MYVLEICAEEIFVTFPWGLENVKSRSKKNFKWAPFWNLISRKRTITYVWSKLSKLYKKDQILHVATIFSLKYGETRTRNGPIPHPLVPRPQVFFCNTSSEGGLLQPPPWIFYTESLIPLHLLPVYRYGPPLFIDTKISTIELQMTSPWRHKVSASSQIWMYWKYTWK